MRRARSRVAQEACEKATVVLAATSRFAEVAPLVRHLRDSGQLTAGLVLRALLPATSTLFEEALAELSEHAGFARHRAGHDRCGAGFRALYDGGPAGFRLSGFPRGARGHERDGFVAEPGGATLKRRMVERVLTVRGRAPPRSSRC